MRATNTTAVQTEKRRQYFERVSMADGLTGLRNRRWLDDRLPRIIEREQRDKRPLCVAMFDVDLFKHFNDEYGHFAGDRVLLEVGRVLSAQARPLDVVARYGGEEFVVVFPNANLEGGRAAADRLRSAVAVMEVELTTGVTGGVTISAGVAEVRSDESSTSALERADRALYRAKENGRNRVEVT
jgi:diguanylate cyclase (GGDEF)-like protein